MRLFLILISFIALSYSASAELQQVFTEIEVTDESGREWLVTHEKGATMQSIADAFDNRYKTGGYEESEFKIMKKGCSTEFLRMDEIYDNCIIDKLPTGAKSTLRNSVINVCDRISCNPNFYEKLKY
mgnify:FL=1